jgi:hypothetical protein
MAAVKKNSQLLVESAEVERSLQDITVGGRIRKEFQSLVLKIAQQAAIRKTESVSGNMLSSKQTTTFEFLDGGVRIVRGVFGPSSGMFWEGSLVKAYVLYELGLNAAKLLRRSVPSHGELENLVQEGIAKSGN